jgi:hypothetical protein
VILLSLLAVGSITTEFELLDRAIATCSRTVVSPAFAADPARRSVVMTETVREQEAIVSERIDIAVRRRALRETRPAGIKVGDNEQVLNMAALALEDRQRALNDRRMLETMRTEAMDVKRRYYLAHCAKGTNDAQD